MGRSRIAEISEHCALSGVPSIVYGRAVIVEVENADVGLCVFRHALESFRKVFLLSLRNLLWHQLRFEFVLFRQVDSRVLRLTRLNRKIPLFSPPGGEVLKV